MSDGSHSLLRVSTALLIGALSAVAWADIRSDFAEPQPFRTTVSPVHSVFIVGTGAD